MDRETPTLFHTGLALQREGALGPRGTRRSPPARRRSRPSAAPRPRGPHVFLNARYGVDSDEEAERARATVHAAFDRIESELGDRDHLVGDRFTVADLTAAALLYPIVTPAEGPQVIGATAALERFRAPLKDRRGYRWVEETFRRYR